MLVCCFFPLYFFFLIFIIKLFWCSVYVTNSILICLPTKIKKFYFVIVSLTFTLVAFLVKSLHILYQSFHFLMNFFSFAVNPCCYYPCQHSGVCVRYGTDQYKCDCSGTGYSGVNCTVRKYINYRVINVSSQLLMVPICALS